MKEQPILKAEAPSLDLLRLAAHGVLLKAEFKNQPGYALGGNPPRWHGSGQAIDPGDDRHKARILQGPPVAVLSSSIVPQEGYAAVREWATRLFDAQGNKADSPDLGEVVLDGRSVRDSMGHSGRRPNRYKFAAFAAVKAVLEHGALVYQSIDIKKDSFYVAAPVVIDGKDDIVTVLVRRDLNTQRMYLHSVSTKEYLLNRRESSADALQAEQPSGTSDSGDVDSLLHRLLAINPSKS